MWEMEINDLPRELKAKIIQGKDLTGNLNFHRLTKNGPILFWTKPRKVGPDRPDIRALDVNFEVKYELSHFIFSALVILS